MPYNSKGDYRNPTVEDYLKHAKTRELLSDGDSRAICMLADEVRRLREASAITTKALFEFSHTDWEWKSEEAVRERANEVVAEEMVVIRGKDEYIEGSMIRVLADEIIRLRKEIEDVKANR